MTNLSNPHLDVTIGQADKFDMEPQVFSASQEKEQTALDLSGILASQITFYMRKAGASTNKVERAVDSVSDAASGKVVVELTTSETDTPGLYYCYLKIEGLSNSQIKRTRKWSVLIEPNYE